MKISYNLNDKSYFKWRQIVKSVPKTWKEFVLWLYHPKLIYQHLKFVLKKKFLSINFIGELYTFLRKVTINTYLRSLQYKILNNVLYLNKRLHTFGLSNTQLCSFWKVDQEAICLLFYYYTNIQYIWNRFQAYFTDCLHFSQLTLQTVIFGFHNIDNDTFSIQNQILLLLKLHIFSARKYGFLSFNNFLNEITNIKNFKKQYLCIIRINVKDLGKNYTEQKIKYLSI